MVCAAGPRWTPRCGVLSRPDSGDYRGSLRPCITTSIAPRRRATFHQALLVVNAGSTSLKLHLVREDEAEPVDSFEVECDAVGHRVVHGGGRFRDPVVLDEEVKDAIRELSSLAPLHNEPALEAIESAQRALPDVPHVAVFDTAFHATLAAEAAVYAVPRHWTENWSVRRYGFHGLSVQWAAERVPVPRLVVCHLGGGCSVTAVRDGRSVETTMGFSPLEGVPMTTRSGSIDPGALLYLLRERGLSVADLDHALEYESGLKGLSGRSGDVRELEQAEASGDERARLALGVYVHRIAAAVAASGAALGGLDALVFTAGVGEHSAAVRERVCERLAFLGIALDSAANASADADADVAAPGSPVRVHIVRAREELVIARAVRALLAVD
jgi:acetate kinase